MTIHVRAKQGIDTLSLHSEPLSNISLSTLSINLRFLGSNVFFIFRNAIAVKTTCNLGQRFFGGQKH